MISKATFYEPTIENVNKLIEYLTSLVGKEISLFSIRQNIFKTRWLQREKKLRAQYFTKMRTIIFILFSIGTANSYCQPIKYNGVYESKIDDVYSTYIRFYADGIILKTTTESKSIEVIRKWFNYENLKELQSGFFITDKNEFTISTFGPNLEQNFILTGIFKKNSDVFELTIHHYDEGMVKSNKYERLFVFRAFE